MSVLSPVSILVDSFPDPAWLIFGVTVMVISLWILTPVPPGYTGIIAIGAIGVILSPDVALTGFYSPATWLIVFGLIVGEATRQSGLADDVGDWLLSTSSPDGPAEVRRTYGRMLTMLCFAGLALTIVVPSSLVRILLLGPIVHEAAKTFDASGTRAGIYLAPLLVTFQSSIGILTAGLPNIAVVGMLESLTGAVISWSQWTMLMFPVMGLGRTLVTIGVVYLLFRPPADETIALDGIDTNGLMGPAQRRMGVFLGVGVVFWASDFVHGLHPLFGAVAVATLAMAPRIGVISFEEVEDIDFSIIFFFGAIFAIAGALKTVGFTEIVATNLLSVIPDSFPDPLVLAGVFLLTLVVQCFIEALAAVGVMTPILVSYAQGAGISAAQVVITEAMATSFVFFPYQSAVLIAILAEDVVDTRTLTRTVVACTGVGIAVLVPLQILILTVAFG